MPSTFSAVSRRMWKFSTSWIARTSAPLAPCVIKRPMGIAPLYASNICRVPRRQQGIGTVHVAARRNTPIDQLPRPLEGSGRALRRAEHDDQLKAAAFGRRQVVDDMKRVVAAG